MMAMMTRFVSLDVHEYLPRLHTYIEKEVATRCDHGDQGPKCDQTPMMDILDTCLRRLSNNSALMKRAKKQAEESKRKLEEACQERDLLRDQKKRFKLWQQSCEAHARAYLAAIGSDSVPPLPSIRKPQIANRLRRHRCLRPILKTTPLCKRM